MYLIAKFNASYTSNEEESEPQVQLDLCTFNYNNVKLSINLSSLSIMSSFESIDNGNGYDKQLCCIMGGNIVIETHPDIVLGSIKPDDIVDNMVDFKFSLIVNNRVVDIEDCHIDSIYVYSDIPKNGNETKWLIDYTDLKTLSKTNLSNGGI